MGNDMPFKMRRSGGEMGSMQRWMQLSSWVAVLVLASLVAVGCAEDAADDGEDTDPPVVMEGSLTPTFENGQTWTVAASYRTQGVRMNELFKALTDELADPTPVAEAMPFIPDAATPPSGELWSQPIYWTYGVITTDYVPEPDNDFHRYSLDSTGEAQPITIIKVVADKDLNVIDIHESLDPVFYLILRDSDMRVRGIHYNYKVRSGRNTVVLEMPENTSERPAPGADQPFFLVPYMMPAFPLDGTAADAYDIELADGALQHVTPEGTSARALFDVAFDGSQVEQRWSDGSPWFDWSVTPPIRWSHSAGTGREHRRASTSSSRQRPSRQSSGTRSTCGARPRSSQVRSRPQPRRATPRGAGTTGRSSAGRRSSAGTASAAVGRR